MIQSDVVYIGLKHDLSRKDSLSVRDVKCTVYLHIAVRFTSRCKFAIFCKTETFFTKTREFSIQNGLGIMLEMTQ